MTRLGVTGHQKLDNDTAWPWVATEMRTAIAQTPPPLVGVTSLAAGADQLFAQLVLELGGTVAVVVPFPDYRTRFAEEADTQRYDLLLARAAAVEVLPSCPSDDEGYLAAGKRVVDQSDAMIAVWDPEHRPGVGGTADIVAYASKRRRPITVLDPRHRIIRRYRDAGA